MVEFLMDTKQSIKETFYNFNLVVAIIFLYQTLHCVRFVSFYSPINMYGMKTPVSL